MKLSGQHDSALVFGVAIFAVLSLAGCNGDPDKIKSLQAENARLQSRNAEFSSRITSLESANNILKSANSVLMNQNSSLENKNGVLATQANSLVSESVSLESQNNNLNGQVQRFENFARFDGVWQCDKGEDIETIVSYRVLTSDSWALLKFNKSTNAFIAGKAGTYTVKDGIYQEFPSVPSPNDKDGVTQFTIDQDGNGMSNGSEHWIRAALQ